MKAKIAKNIAILTEYAAHLFKTQVIIFTEYIVFIGFIYLCGVYQNTGFGHFRLWINDDWALVLRDVLDGKLSADFQIRIIFISCHMHMFMSSLKYYRDNNVSSYYARYCLLNNIESSIMTMAFVYFLHGHISIDIMIGIFLVSIFLECLACLLLKITGTKKTFF